MKKLMFVCAAMVALGATAGGPDVTIDFSKEVGRINPKLHSSSIAPGFHCRGLCNYDAEVRAMNFYAGRTHDWALVNQGQRIVDTHFIFPLMHLDAANPSNYYFKATDAALKIELDLGHKILYRLGTSIEHTGNQHFNALAPKDHEKYAEVMAGIMRHYLKGWADGYEWGSSFQGWEFWCEPDSRKIFEIEGCQEKDKAKAFELHRNEFCKLFVTVFKRLKAEFPDQQIGGPSLTYANLDYIRYMMECFKAADAAPDFISWHGYGYPDRPDVIYAWFPKVRALLDEMGFQKTRLIFNEWHYLRSWESVGWKATPRQVREGHQEPWSPSGIESAAFNLHMLTRFQESCLDEAYWYGNAAKGNWGYLNDDGSPSKAWYSMVMFGDFIRQAQRKVETVVDPAKKTLTAIAGLSEDGKTGSFIVTDYRGKCDKIFVELKGLGNVRRMTAYCLDSVSNLSRIPLPVSRYAFLPRNDDNSAAYFITYEFK